MSMSCEFHFQEGFAGPTVTLAVDGKVRFRFPAGTRLQTGLAQIKTLRVRSWDRLSRSLCRF